MLKFMKMLNNISRSQSLYRQSKIAASDLNPAHYSFVMAICASPGRSQEDLASELCINKSTVARNLTALEENGYVERRSQPNDKRQFSVYPTEKMLAVFPNVKAVSMEWMELLSDGISQSELDVFDSVLRRMQERAGEIIGKQEESK